MRSRLRPSRGALWIGFLAAGLLFAALFAPPAPWDIGDPRLSTFSTAPQGARGFHDLASRLGWSVRNTTLLDTLPDSRAVYAVLAPVVQPTPREVHALLEHVRAGGGLLLAISDEGPVADSLGLTREEYAGPIPSSPEAPCPASSRITRQLRLAARGSAALGVDQRVIREFEIFLRLGAPNRRGQVAAIGFPMGKGRVGVFADPILLANDVMRDCGLRAGVTAIKLLHYVSSDTDGKIVRRRLVFDEYRQGYGPKRSIVAVVLRFASTNALGRTLTQLAAAGVLLVLAIAPRALPPTKARRVTRRSPLEHVDALALAYREAGGTRVATRQLVRGLRRRLRRSPATRATPDEQFLVELARDRRLEADVSTLRQALDTRMPKRAFEEAGRSITRIERTLTSDH